MWRLGKPAHDMSLQLHFITVSVSFKKFVSETERAERLAVLTTKGVLRVNQLGAYGDIMIKLA